MPNPFVSFGQKEDMQDDTYKLIAIHIAHCLDAQITKDSEKYYNHVKAVYSMIHNRINDSSGLLSRIKKVRDKLYNRPQKSELSKIYDECDEIFLELTRVLDEKGILFRMRSDPENLLSRGGALH